MTTWNDPGLKPVPKDGRMYRVKSGRRDRGFVWWDADSGGYGWVAEGKILTAANITHWAEFEEDSR